MDSKLPLKYNKIDEYDKKATYVFII